MTALTKFTNATSGADALDTLDKVLASNLSTDAMLYGGTSRAGVNELLLVLGQSLAGTQGVSGAGNLPAGFPNDRVKFFNTATGVFDTYNPLTLPTWGPEMGYALSWLADTANDGKTLYIAKWWDGGTQLGAIAKYGQIGSGNIDWSPNLFGNNWDIGRGVAMAARAKLIADRVPFIVRDVMWVQGETDSRGTATLADYTANAARIYSDIRTQLASPTTNIIGHFISQYYSDYPRDAMIAKQRALAEQSPFNFLLDTQDMLYQGDTIHWSNSGAAAAGPYMYSILHGGIAPAALTLDDTIAYTAMVAGDFVGRPKALSRDGTLPLQWSIAGSGSADFTINLNQELVIKAGATLTANTSKTVTLRATCPRSGKFTEATFTIAVRVLPTVSAGQFFDNFNRADAADIADGTNWRKFGATGNPVSIENKRTKLNRVSGTVPSAYKAPNIGSTTNFAEATVVGYCDTPHIGAAVVDDLNWIGVRVRSNVLVEVLQMVAGAATVVGTATNHGMVIGDVVRTVRTGNTFDVVAVKAGVSSTLIAAVAVPSALQASTDVGIVTRTGNTGPLVDNFRSGSGNGG